MNRHAERLELNKILLKVSSYCALKGGKELILSLTPSKEIQEARERLLKSEEAKKLLFFFGAGKIEAYPDLSDSLERAEKGATLSFGELLALAKFLRSARILSDSILNAPEEIVLLRELAFKITTNRRLEEEIFEKILNEEEMSDRASEKLFSIRKEKRILNERIKAKLSDYLTGEDSKYLQEALVTMRGDRYVIPVKVEYKRSVKGFVHDRSQTGQTVFIEPEEILELNNELRSLILDEKEEIERILFELSQRVKDLTEALRRNEEILFEIDSYYARAEYAYALKCVCPELNARGIIEIKKGRHPLLDPKSAIPVSLTLGKEFRFLVLSGANTGGKTVTLKMCGLFLLMAACGLFVPAEEGTKLALFENVFCDIGDSQSIEENLSTFSSHVLNLKEILSRAEKNSFVLIDEPGAGTDPEEGQALACAILSALMEKGCSGIVTTHYAPLKEFAFQTEGAENGCMEFDGKSLKPLFSLKIGVPGSSNALHISARLGLPEQIIEKARGFLSEGARNFEKTIMAAEKSRVESDRLLEETRIIKKDWEEKLSLLEKEEEAFQKEREKFLSGAKAEAKRIVSKRTERAEEILEEIEAIFQKEELSESDLIAARTLKHKMENLEEEKEEKKTKKIPVDPNALKAGDEVFLESMNARGVVLSVRDKKTAEVRCGEIKVRCKLSELFCASPDSKSEKREVSVLKDLKERPTLSRECNVIGKTVDEALYEVEAFLDGALLQNLSTVRIVHGMGTGSLRKAIHAYLKKQPRVEEFRLGVYGEGESGVTIVTLK